MLIDAVPVKFVTTPADGVPRSPPLTTKVPVVAGSVSVVDPATAGAARVTDPEVDPNNARLFERVTI
jgi:hypothetical protein